MLAMLAELLAKPFPKADLACKLRAALDGQDFITGEQAALNGPRHRDAGAAAEVAQDML
jgi:hypothetical protein